MKTNTQTFNYNVNKLVLAILNRPADEQYTRAIVRLRDYDKNTFTAQEVEISGSTLKGLCNYGILKVIGQDKVTLRMGFGINKTVFYNIYEKNTDLAYDKLLEYIDNERLAYYESKIKQAEQELEYAQDDLRRYQLKAKIIGMKED